MRAATSHNSSNTDTPFVEIDYCGRSIVFCRRGICHLVAAKNNGGVTADVMCNVRKRTVKRWRVQTMNRLAYFTIFILLPIGCKESTTSVTKLPEPVEFRQAFIPLAVGNKWTYRDSLFSGDSISTETYTIRVSSFRYDNGKVWWQLQQQWPTSTMNLMEVTARNDSIFSLQYNFDHPVSSLDYLPPPATDTLRFFSLSGGDVVIEKSVWLAGEFIVPVGSFDSCAIFFSRITPDGFTEVLKPRIGIIQKEIQYTSSLRRKVVLIDYELTR